MKWSNDSVELGASKIAPLILDQGAFGTVAEDVRQLVLNARKGLKSTTYFNKAAIERGNRLEPVLITWAVDELQAMCGPSVLVNGIEPIDADRYEPYRLAASCDHKVLIVGGELTVPNPMGNDFPMKGEIPLEIKTDGTNDGPPKYDYIIQLNVQMMCMGADYGVIAVLSKGLKFTLYPYKRDEELCKLIKDRVTDFWHRVDNDIPYPEKKESKPETINLDRLNSKKSVLDCIDNYHKCESEVDKWTEEKNNAKNVLVGVLEAHNAQYAEIGDYKINYPVVERKATPEKTVPAKPATQHRRFSIEVRK